MARLNPLFNGPGPMRVVLQKFFVVVGFDHQRLDFAQALHNHFRRVAEIGDKTETARSRVKSKTERIDRVMWHGKSLDRDVADGKLGACPKNSPVTMLLEQPVASNCLRGECVAINRHIKFAAENFESANMIAVFVSKKDAVELVGRNATLRQAQHQLPRAQAAIDKNLAMLSRDQCAVPGAAAAEHGQTKHDP